MGTDNSIAATPTEAEHVHAVYEDIAHHFSDTRYKAWPRVDQFVREQVSGSVGCDVGAGNGKYLVYGHVFILGCDRSAELARIAWDRNQRKRNDVFRCDGLAVPVRARVDFALSIAVVHHFSTRERRVAAIASVLRALAPGGTALIYVWALEQKTSRRGWTEDMDPDVMVPWVNNKDKSRVHHRYYHLYRRGELEDDVRAAAGTVVESGYEKDNWWCVCKLFS